MSVGDLRQASVDLILKLYGAAGRGWLEDLPALIAVSEQRWGLEVGPAFSGSSVAFVAPARRPDGSVVILKALPCATDARQEADALRHWGGDGAVGLLDSDPENGTLLLEAIEPGDHLESRSRREGADVACTLLGHLWGKPPPADHCFPKVADVAQGLAVEIAELSRRLGLDTDQALVDEALELCLHFAHQADEPAHVVAHGDLHVGNVLSGGDGRWVAIDPKPCVGDRSYDTASLVCSLTPPTPSVEDARRVVQSVAEGLEIEGWRVRAWAIIQHLVRSLRWCDTALASPAHDRACARAMQQCGLD